MHIPVLCEEVKKVLVLKRGGFYIDGTLGGGGHARMILKEIMPGGKFLACDRDESAVKLFQKEFANEKKNVILRHANYATISEIVSKERLGRADGIVLDLGFSSDQIEDTTRGLSFLHNAPLDMRYDMNESIPTAKDILRDASEEKLYEIFHTYGEERYARVIANSIVRERKKSLFQTTDDVVRVVTNTVPSRYLHKRIHPATRIFQALRIAVNHEFEYLEEFLVKIPQIVCDNGRVAIISFHSCEDRIVKQYFQKLEKEGCAARITKKPIVPTLHEIRANPRSRSAKLRAIIFYDR